MNETRNKLIVDLTNITKSHELRTCSIIAKKVATSAPLPLPHYLMSQFFGSQVFHSAAQSSQLQFTI